MNIQALVLTTISGISTALGGLIVIFFPSPKEKSIGWLLGIAAGVMIYVSIFDLIPEALENTSFLSFIFWSSAGFVFFHILVDYILPSDIGFETAESSRAAEGDKSLRKTSFVVLIGIFLHNIPEGWAVWASSLTKSQNLALNVAFAIGLHNLPEGVVVASTIFASTKSRWTAIKWTLFSGLSEPAGGLLFGYTFQSIGLEQDSLIISYMLAIVSGMMLYISITELIPTSLRCLQSITKMIAANLLGASIIALIGFIVSSNQLFH